MLPYKIEYLHKKDYIYTQFLPNFSEKFLNEMFLNRNQLISKYNCKYLLSDCSHLEILSFDGQAWIKSNIVDKLSEIGIIKVAIILPKNILGRIIIKSILSTSQTPINIQQFIHKEDALNWLKGVKGNIIQRHSLT